MSVAHRNQFAAPTRLSLISLSRLTALEHFHQSWKGPDRPSVARGNAGYDETRKRSGSRRQGPRSRV